MIEEVRTKDKLAVFFYFLLRDSMLVGELEDLMAITEEKFLDCEEVLFSNEIFGKMAIALAERMKR